MQFDPVTNGISNEASGFGIWGLRFVKNGKSGIIIYDYAFKIVYEKFEI